MGNPMVDAKKRGRQEQKPHDWQPSGERMPLDVPTTDWDRGANQSLDPNAKNPKRTRAQRELYSRGGGQL